MLWVRAKRHPLRRAFGVCASLALTAALTSLSVAPGSEALPGARADRAQLHPGFKRGLASWYHDDGLRTACGFHAKFGVANRTLPCGTRVTFWHHRHRVVAVVDDRGPYGGGRTWDLDEHTANVLHVTGVEWVLASAGTYMSGP